MRERVCPPSLSGTPNIRSSSLFLLHRRDGSQRDTLPMPLVFPFAETVRGTLFVPRCHQGRFRARSATRHRLCGTWSRNGTTVPVRDKHALHVGRAFLPRGTTTRRPTSQRDETGHRPSPPAAPPNWPARSTRCSPCPMLHQSSAAATAPER